MSQIQTKQTLSANAEMMRQHLNFLYSDMKGYDDGFIEISILNKSETFEVSDIDKAVERALLWNSQGKNVYTVGSLLLPDFVPATDSGRSSDNDFYASSVVWCDIDDPIDKEALKFLYDHCKPNAAVITAHVPNRRLQLWWKLDAPLTDADTLREALQGVQEALGGDPKVRNITSLMRLGGGINMPTEAKQAKGRIIEATEYHHIHNDKIPIDAFIRAYPIKEYFDPVLASPPVKTAIVSSGGLSTQIVDGREQYMSDMVYAAIINLTGKLGRWPTAQEVYDDVWPVYSQKVGARGQRTLDQDHRGARAMQQKIQSKLRLMVAGRVRSAPSLESVLRNAPKKSVTGIPATEMINQETGEILELKLTDWIASTRYKGEAKPIQWLVEGVLPLGVPCLLAAMGGLGKSFIALDMCIKVATLPTGIAPAQILGHDVKEHGKAVLITAEDSFDSIHRRINKLVSPERLQATLDNLIIIPMSELDISQLLVKEGKDGLEMTEFFANVKQQLMGLDNIKLIVIDPLQAFVGADITGKPEAAQFMWSAFAKISSQTKATFLSTHHMRKDGNKDIKTAADAREGIRGTTGLVDGARLAYVMWQVTKDVGEAIAAKLGKEYVPDRFIQGAVVKANDESNKGLMTFYREENGTLTSHGEMVIKGDNGKEVTMNPDRQEMYDAILDAILDHGEMVTVYQGEAMKKCITFDQLREKLELRAYKEFTLDSDEGDTRKAARRVKNSTNNARVALKKMGKIGFHNNWIWAISQEVKSE